MFSLEAEHAKEKYKGDCTIEKDRSIAVLCYKRQVSQGGHDREVEHG